jgi:hypothetical protein
LRSDPFILSFVGEGLQRTTVGAILGGGISLAMGGSFGQGAAQGAATSAIAFLCNETMHEWIKNVTDKARKSLNLDLDKAKAIANEELTTHRGHNDLDDAMRHADWSKRMGEEINALTSWFAGVGHEIDGLMKGQSWSEFRMDLHNNAEGRVAASVGRPINPNNLVIDPDNNDRWIY